MLDRYELAWLMWCQQAGLRPCPEDREPMTNWLKHPEAMLDPDEVAERDALLDMADQLLAVTEFTPTRWWRAVVPDGTLWAEASDEADVRRRARPDDTIQRLHERVDRVWIEA